MSGAAVAARGAAKRFGRATALRDIDFDLGSGEALALLGPNGAGKSTLLRLLAGLSRPSDGRVEIDGVAATRPGSRARVGYAGHASFLSPSLDVRENLIFAARLYGVASPAARADALLERDGLGDIATRRVQALSRGQVQRAAIARALVHEPDLLLLDEPSTGLDRRAASELSARLAEVRERGCTLIVVTHDPAQASALVERGLVLADGRVHWQGPAAESARALEEVLAARDGRAA